jgi:uncharacterized membrane protein YbaN (DUF454 family)
VKTVRIVLAVISILIGIAGLILPILPGWLFFAVAALLLFPESKMARKVRAKAEQKWPSSKSFFRFLLGDEQPDPGGDGR